MSDTEQAALAIAKVTAARDVLTAIAEGRWVAHADVLAATAALVAAAARHARTAA